MFLEEVTQYRLEEKYKPVYEAWKAQPDRQTTSQLLRAVTPEIDRGIMAHLGHADPLLRSKARRLTLQAVQTYDPSKAQLGTHIVNQLQGLKRMQRKQTQILQVPERISLDQNRLEQARLELSDQLGREPSTTELADQTGLSIRRIKQVRTMRQPLAEGMFVQEDAGAETTRYMPTVRAVRQDQIEPWMELVYADLNPINQKILEWTVGLHGEPVLPNQEIARRLRLSPGAISQRKATIQALLETGERYSPF